MQGGAAKKSKKRTNELKNSRVLDGGCVYPTYTVR
jgi:hypothetical protein